MPRLLVLPILALLTSSWAWGQDPVRDSMVKIYSKLRSPDLARPWMKQPARDASGTGAIIEGHRILTSAHVVLYASQITVQADRSTERLPAQVEAIAPGMDLAILKMNDDSLFEKRPPLPLSEGLPKTRSTVNAYGFPIGGEQMSVTSGIISRVEFAGYAYGAAGLRIQVDAALNPGNSGGPAIADGKIVGVVFSTLKQAENIGYLIPAEEVRMFLEDIEDGEYQGKPRLLDKLQTVENPALRARLQLDEATGGMMVTHPSTEDPSHPLRTWDVITHVGDQALDRQGTVLVGGELKLSFQYLAPQLARDGKLPVTVARDGQPMKLEVPVHYRSDLLIPHLEGDYPRHFLVGPLVFTTASQELVAAIGPEGREAFSVRQSPLISRRFDRRQLAGDELVVMGPRFPHVIAEGYDSQLFAVVSQVNDVAIKNLAHLVESIRQSEGRFLVLTFSGTYETMVFDRQELIDSTAQILEDEGIRYQMSPDLRELWGEK